MNLLLFKFLGRVIKKPQNKLNKGRVGEGGDRGECLLNSYIKKNIFFIFFFFIFFFYSDFKTLPTLPTLPLFNLSL